MTSDIVLQFSFMVSDIVLQFNFMTSHIVLQFICMISDIVLLFRLIVVIIISIIASYFLIDTCDLETERYRCCITTGAAARGIDTPLFCLM